MSLLLLCCLFFFNDTATTEIYTLSLHDALPICAGQSVAAPRRDARLGRQGVHREAAEYQAVPESQISFALEAGGLAPPWMWIGSAVIAWRFLTPPRRCSGEPTWFSRSPARCTPWRNWRP